MIDSKLVKIAQSKQQHKQQGTRFEIWGIMKSLPTELLMKCTLQSCPILGKQTLTGDRLLKVTKLLLSVSG